MAACFSLTPGASTCRRRWAEVEPSTEPTTAELDDMDRCYRPPLGREVTP
jgi:hypothetical protein